MDFRAIAARLKTKNVFMNEPLRRHTSFRTGGRCAMFICPERVELAIDCVKVLRQSGVPFIVIGNGTNLLVSDHGYNGAVICMSGLNGMWAEDDEIIATCGVRLSSLCAYAHSEGLVGLEFAAGIPGTLGGGIFMNAGAYGAELKDIVRTVTFIEDDGQITTATAPQLEFGYRKSIFMHYPAIILLARLQLAEGNIENARAYTLDLLAKRRESQPVELPSAGSTFKRPEGHFAAALIEQCGLKGERIGGAEVSTKHAGFIVNIGGASSADIYELIALVQARVFDMTGVELEPEVQFVGEF